MKNATAPDAIESLDDFIKLNTDNLSNFYNNTEPTLDENHEINN